MSCEARLPRTPSTVIRALNMRSQGQSRSVNWAPQTLDVERLPSTQHQQRRRKAAQHETFTIERLTLGAGCMFVLVNLVIFLYHCLSRPKLSALPRRAPRSNRPAYSFARQ
jgi:hypothetical protein